MTDAVLSGPWGAILLGFVFVCSLATIFFSRLCAINPREDDGMYPDPDKGERQ